MNATRTKNGPIQLDFAGGKVVVTPEDRDKFVLTAQQAVEGCAIVSRQERLADLFEEQYLRPIHAWCLKHSSQVASCFLGRAHGPSLQLFVIPATGGYDFALNEPLAKLERELQVSNWPTDALQIPHGDLDELRAFFDPQHSLLIYAQPQTTSG
jgi:hypothetical protein